MDGIAHETDSTAHHSCEEEVLTSPFQPSIGAATEKPAVTEFKSSEYTPDNSPACTEDKSPEVAAMEEYLKEPHSEQRDVTKPNAPWEDNRIHLLSLRFGRRPNTPLKERKKREKNKPTPDNVVMRDQRPLSEPTKMTEEAACEVHDQRVDIQSHQANFEID